MSKIIVINHTLTALYVALYPPAIGQIPNLVSTNHLVEGGPYVTLIYGCLEV